MTQRAGMAGGGEVVSVDGDRIRLHLTRKIGSGAYSDVYRCTMESDEVGRDDKVYACKRIKLFQDTDRCLLEAAIMASLDHPNLATAHTIHLNDAEEMFIVQDLAIGDLTSSAFVDGVKSRGDLERMISWAHQMVQGMMCLHREEIVHGDIKAANILVYENERVAITDFSLATNMCNGVDDGRTRLIISTVTHRAPEVHAVCAAEDALRKGDPAPALAPWGPAADVWSMGCTLYEIAHGKTLFEYKGSDDEVWEKINAWARSDNLRQNPWGAQIFPDELSPPQPSANSPKMPRAELVSKRIPHLEGARLLDDLISRCLVVDPRRRISARGMLLHPLFAGRVIGRYNFSSMKPVFMNSDMSSRVEGVLSAMAPPSSTINLAGAGESTKPVKGASRAIRPEDFLSRGANSAEREIETGTPLRERYKTVYIVAKIIATRCVSLMEKHGVSIVCEACWRLSSRMCIVPISKSSSCDEEVRKMEHAICSLLRFRFLEGIEHRRSARA